MWAYTRYTFTVREDERYQPHPGLCRGRRGSAPVPVRRYRRGLLRFSQITDFPETGDRPGTGQRLMSHAIKRLADPLIGSLMLGFMAQHIVGTARVVGATGRGSARGLAGPDDFAMEGWKWWMSAPSPSPSRPLSAVRVLAGDALFRPLPLRWTVFYHNPAPPTAT